MGCISSKLLPPGPGDRNGDARATMRGRVDHVVSLTSTTYGVLDLHPKHGTAAPAAAACQEKEQPQPQKDKPISREWNRASSKRPPPLVVPNAKKPAPAAAKPESSMEVINAWEIMAGLEDADAAVWSPAKKPAKLGRWSPARVIAMALPSPKKSAAKRRNTPGKENSPLQRCSGNNKPGDVDADRVLRPYNSIDNSKLSKASKRFSPASARIVRKPGPAETGGGMTSSRRSLSPLFDPELLASIERELSEEGAHIKRVVGSEKPKHPKAAPPAMVAEGKCPPGGGDAVVLYTTTLHGIRKTFEECNAVRAAIEAHDVKVIERDVSMDSGYREELRLLLGGREVRVPAVFVRGRHVGGAAEVTKLEEEGKLKALLQGLPRARVWCAGCAGVRFVVCRDCNGSRKVRVDGERKETVQCGGCNENGLVRCPICS